MRRLVVVLAIAGWPLLLAAPAGAAVDGACDATFNGVAVDRIDTLGSPLELRADETLVFSGTSSEGTTTARVSIVAGPLEVDSTAVAYPSPVSEFAATIDLDDVTPYAVGLFRVRGTTDGCTAEAWLRVTGRFPIATLAGLTAAGLALGGLTGQLGAVASGRRWSRLAAAAGGIATGAGVAILGQEFGRLQPSYWALGGSIFAAMLLGFLLATALDPTRRQNRRRRAAAEAPAAVIQAAERVARATGEQPAVAAEPPPDTPYWCYVLGETQVFDLTDHTHAVGTLRPGTWYLAKREVGAWVHVSSTNGLEGWAPRHAVNREG